MILNLGMEHWRLEHVYDNPRLTLNVKFILMHLNGNILKSMLLKAVEAKVNCTS